MTTTQRRRLYYVLALMVGMSIVVALILYALKQNINLFYTPEELLKLQPLPINRIRVGGMVLPNSLQISETLEVNFIVTDFKQNLKIRYQGILPDLFREGQGVVALGTLQPDQIFVADQILAKHDENYMPPELHELKVANVS